MADEPKLPDLLPWDFAPETVRTPLVILQHQAHLVSEKSQGRLDARVEEARAKETVTFSFVVEAPELSYAIRMFSCAHHADLPYPVTVVADELRGLIGEYPEAHGEKEFTELVKKALGGRFARSVFQSLLARMNAQPKPGDGERNRTGEQK
ncbi:MAG: hypothetical protein QM820_56355 [Minicystis sp.]